MSPATLDLYRLALPLVRPFRTSRGEESVRDVLVARWTGTDGVSGWAESAADERLDLAGAEILYFDGIETFVSAPATQCGKMWNGAHVEIS